MDKRLLNFMLVSMLLFIGYMELMKLWMPKPEAQEGAEDPAVAEQVEDVAEQPNDAAETAAGVSEADPVVAESVPSDDATQTVNEDPALPPAEQSWFTIGSLDPASGYTMLVTFNSTGAAVERIELNNPHYSDLDDKTAYIGHLAYTNGTSGAKVNVVGAGTPAAQAGIQVGDEITSIGDDAVSSAASAPLALKNFKYGADVPITLSRNGKSIQLTVASIRRPLEVIRPETIPPSKDDGKVAEVGKFQQQSYLLGLSQVGHIRADFQQDELANLPSLRKETWYATVAKQSGDTVVEFRFPISNAQLAGIGLKSDAAMEVIKRFWLPRRTNPEEADAANPSRDYHLNFDVEFVNKGSADLEVGYRIDGPTGLPLEGWWYSYKTHPTAWGGAGVRDIVWKSNVEPHKMYTNPSVTKHAKKNPERPELVVVESAQKLEYLGVDAQYFNSSLLASADSAKANQAVVFEKVEAFPLSGIDPEKSNRTPITFRADSSVLMVPASQTATQQFEIFAGPKHPDVLSQYGLDQCIVYGWFKFFAKVMAWLLHLLHSLVGNYGISIILLTMLVRACMFPIGRQQAKSAKMMQELGPEIKKIKEKYPNDQEKATKAQQELFRKHNYNPLLGCAPMFLQLPVFIGLYRALSVDIELRQTPLIQGVEWCSNLAAPDMLMQWNNLIPIQSLTGYTGFLGPYLNVLPLISTCLFLVHQQLFTPPPTDEQQEMQQKMMKFMMIFMLVIFFKVPAGLCLYFITSSLWALGERLMLPKDDKKTSVIDEASNEAKPSKLVDATNKIFNRDKEPVKESVADRKKRRKRSKK